MKFMLNGAWREVPAIEAAGAALAAAAAAGTVSGAPVALDALLGQLGFGNARVATALNGEFVPAHARAQALVREGDRLEVLSPMQGG